MCVWEGAHIGARLFLMIRRPPRSTRKESSAASDVYKRQEVYGEVKSATETGDGPVDAIFKCCLLYTSPSPRDAHESRMPSSA